MKVKMHLAMSGHFTMALRKDGVERQVADFDNLITDAGLDMHGAIPTVGSAPYNLMMGNCQVGTGTTPEAITDTHIETFLAQSWVNNNYPSNSATTHWGSSPRYEENRITYTFALGAVVGNISEVVISACFIGAGGLPNPNPLGITQGDLLAYSRALIKDGFGNPTTITVKADEQLIVYWTHRVYIPEDSSDGTIIGTTSYTSPAGTSSLGYTAKAYNSGVKKWYMDAQRFSDNQINASGDSRTYKTITLTSSQPDGPTGSLLDGSAINIAVDAYVPGSFSRTSRLLRSSGQSNDPGGFEGFEYTASHCMLQVKYASPIMKTNLHTFRQEVVATWGRY